MESITDEPLHCGHGDLMGPVGLLVQGLLAAIAFASLIVKRYCEPFKERRSWKVWFFDTSKQGVGAAIIHFANVFLADIFVGDPCTWYFVSFLLDSTLGLIVIYSGLKISQILSMKYNWTSLLLGEYGNPPQCSAWVGQCGVYILVMVVEKFIMTLLVLFHFWTKVREIILSPITNPNLEIVLVMFIVPFIVNALIFWMVDNFLKKNALGVRSPSVYTTSNGGHCTTVEFRRSEDHCIIEDTPQQDCELLPSQPPRRRTISTDSLSDGDQQALLPAAV